MGNYKILLIDDEETAYLMIRRQFLRVPAETYELTWITSSDEGLKALSDGHHDACLLDYRIGIHNGLELLREASLRGLTMPVIMLTNSDDPKVDKDATQLGASDFLQKDQITPIVLERTIRYAIRQFATLTALKKSHDRHRELENEIQQISEREQRRLGQDLHDGLGQSLTGIAFMGKVLQQHLLAKNMVEAEEAGNLVRLINEALMQTRQLARGLCPVSLDDHDIEAAMLQLGENLRMLFGVCCVAKVNPEIKILDTAVAVQLYRIAQEASTNAIKHGKARNILLSLSTAGNRLVLRIEDDGVGFPKNPAKSKGMGLRVMQHRANSIGATLVVRPGRNGGTVVTCTLRQGQAVEQDDPTEPEMVPQ